VSQSIAELVRSLHLVWRNPGTRLAAWTHFLSQFPVVVLAMLWGFPFLVKGEGLSQQAAGALLMMMTGTWVVSGLIVAKLVAKFPYWCSSIVLAVAMATASLWTVVLCWPGSAPHWLLVALVCVAAVSGPASMVCFDLARTFTLAGSLGRANGVVNMAGFAGSLLAMLLIGLVLDRCEPRGPAFYDLDAFRAAMAVQYPRHGGQDFFAMLHAGDETRRALEEVRGMFDQLLASAAASGAVRSDVSSRELADYCLNALAAAGNATDEAAVKRLVDVTTSGLRE
jgi:MFS family permease